MGSGILIIVPEDETIIKAALDAARANPIPWAVAKAVIQDGAKAKVLLGDRKVGVDEVRAKYPPQQIILGTYRVALSFEEQPAGIFKHLSVSSERKDKVPGPEVMQMVCEAFGFSDTLCRILGSARATILSPATPFRVWVEEFDPGHMAINVIELENVTQ